MVDLTRASFFSFLFHMKITHNTNKTLETRRNNELLPSNEFEIYKLQVFPRKPWLLLKPTKKMPETKNKEKFIHYLFFT